MSHDTKSRPPFRWRTRVYWEDTDAGGVVYHASYVRFFERARSEWMRERGLGQDALRKLHKVMFVVRDMRIAFRRAARLDDLLDNELVLMERRAASLRFMQKLVRPDDASVIAEADVRIACVDAERFVPTAIPDDLLPGLLAP